MRIYFAGAIRGGRDDKTLYMQIIEDLKQYGEVVTEHIGDENLDIRGEAEKDNKLIHDRDLEWLKSADYVIAEVTQASLGVGYEIGKSTEWDKKTICLYRPSKNPLISAMIVGCNKVTIYQYESLADLQVIFKQVFSKIPVL
jgi:nucleoside 2-deoxyribosyltransferase